ncbi:MAG TPA: glycosyltransferase [Candidatus Limnocylindrales bacterium]|nr:glycosyltransferase [Candidatus Limnocylindrales bacterium]
MSQGPVVPQRLVLVLPSSGEFDSRTYRIATSALARGHTVTVLARWHRGLALEEQHPAGYTILRVPASSADGLPLPAARRLVGQALRRRRARRAGAVREAARGGSSAGMSVAGSAGAASGASAGASASGGLRAARASLPRRVASGLIRRGAVPLTIRSHTMRARAAAPPADIYHGMAFMGVPVALDLATRHKARAVYDARDIYLEARNLARQRGPVRWFLGRMERGWARRSAAVVTVNDAYADVMAGRFGARPLVVMNCSARFEPPDPPEHRFHDALGLAPGTPVVLYHGGLFPERGIEQLIAAVRELDEVVLVLMGYGVLEPELRARAAGPELGGRLHILPAVPPHELHAWVASADVAAMPIQPSTLNHRLTTPNKLFEAMTAGVPIVASDLPGMATIVRAVGAGELVDPTDPPAIAAAIRDLLSAPDGAKAALRARELEAVRTTYNWDAQVEKLFALYGRLTGRPW